MNKVLITLKNKAQSTVEYAMLFAIVVGALALATTYVRRGLAGKLDATAVWYNTMGKGEGGAEYASDFFTDTRNYNQQYRVGHSANMGGQRGGQIDEDEGAKLQAKFGNEAKNVSLSGDVSDVFNRVNDAERHDLKEVWNKSIDLETKGDGSPKGDAYADKETEDGGWIPKWGVGDPPAD
ncbi:MAG: hypothetical protein PHS09_03725 [Candidatus Omnitrophica bacterium]|nr:hypothetical protein [Candidatus Omnitrophota bacterium]MDD5512866.1 hypothetical protein [Candidatus Omnitrophota bacterium]